MAKSRYHSFNVFMNEVIQNADKRVDLEELFELKNMQVVEIIIRLIRGGWWVFIAVVALLTLGPIGFVAAIVTFLSSPPGLVVSAIFGVAAIASIKTLYQNKMLPLAVREVGRQFKPRWESVEGNQDKVNCLLEEATTCLINKARKSQRELLEAAINS